MLSTDRQEFDVLMATLCAAYNTPPTAARKDSYWRAFGKQTLSEFAHMVDLALEAEDLEGMPTVPQLRKLKYRKRFNPVVSSQTAHAKDDRDSLLKFGNRLVIKLMLSRGGLGSMGTFVPGEGMKDYVGSPALLKVRRAVLSLVDWFSPGVLEQDDSATPALFIEMLSKALDSELDERTRQLWKEIAQKPDAQLPFPPFMARDYNAPPAQLELTA